MELLISLKGKLEKSLPESLRRTASEVAELQKKMGKLNEVRIKAEKYKALERTAQSLGNQFSQATAKAAQLESELRNNQRTAAQYKAQLDQAKAALSSMSRSANPEAYKAARENIKQLTAVYKSAQAAVKASEKAFKQTQEAARSSATAYSNNQSAMRRLSAELQQAGFHTQHFASSQVVLQHELNRTTQALEQARRVQQQYDAQQRQQAERQRAHSDAQQTLYNAAGNWQTGLEVSKTILSPFAGAISSAMEFEAEMAKVKSMTQMDNIKMGNWELVNSEMQKLTEQAKEMGRTTQFTSVQAAQAQFELAKAGYDTEKVYASLPHVLNMAAVENMELGDAARIATNIMAGFGLGADKIEHSIDVLAYTSTHANTDLRALGETMKYAAPVAKSFGASLEETATMAKFMADAGITGSQAGTSLRQGLLRLVAPPKKASKAMQEMGISLSDAQAEWENANAAAKAYGINLDATKGPGEQLISVIKQIEAGMAGASDQEKIAALNAITGINAVSGWAAVMANSSGSIEDFYQSLRNCDGAAKQAAGTMQDTTKGAFTRFGSAAEAVAQNIGDVFLPVVRQAAETAAVYATALAEWVGKHQAIVIVAGIAATAISGLIMTVLSVNVAVAGWRLLGTTIAMVGDASLIATAKTKMLAAANMATGKAMAFLSSGTKIATAAQAALNAVMALNPYVLAAIAIVALIGAIVLLTANFDKLKETATIVFDHISGTVEAWAATIQAKFAEALNKITEVWNSVTGQSLESSELIGAIFNNLGFYISSTFDVMAGIVGTAVSVIINLIASIAQIVGGVINIIAGLLTGDWSRAWNGAGQAVEGFASGTLGTIKTVAEGVGSIFDTLMGKSDEMQRKAEQAKAAAETSNMLASTGVSAADATALANAEQTAAATREAADAAAAASQNAEMMAQGMEATGQSAQQAATYTEQLQNVMAQVPAQTQAAFSGMGEQSAVAAQAVNTNMQQIPTQTQATFQQLPPIATQGTDAMAQEFSQLAAKCQPGGDAFVQAANNWGQQAYENIARWADQMAQVVVDRLSQAWAQISAQFSAGLNVNVTTSGAGIAHNAEGGIYNKGAFLTTFAEKSPEAAIPLDGSSRAISLWQKAGEILGMIPKGTSDKESFDLPSMPDITKMTMDLPDARSLPVDNKPSNLLGEISKVFTAAPQAMAHATPIINQLKSFLPIEGSFELPPIMNMVEALPPEISSIADVIAPPTEAQMAAAPIALEPTSEGGSFEINFSPQITINGNADSGTVSQMEGVLAKIKADLMREVERKFGGMMADYNHNQRRRSLAT